MYRTILHIVTVCDPVHRYFSIVGRFTLEPRGVRSSITGPYVMQCCLPGAAFGPWRSC